MHLHPLIADLQPTERSALLECCELRSYKRDEILVDVDGWTDQIYCVASGLLRAVTPGRNDGMEVTTDFIRRNEFFLGPSLSEDRYKATQTLIAALPSSVYLVPVSAIRKLCALYPVLTMGLIEHTMDRLTMMRGQLRRMSALPTETLVSRVLQELTQLAPTSSGGYDKRITQAVIASYSGLSRGAVNKAMRDLEDRGAVRRDEHGNRVMVEFAARVATDSIER